MRVEEGRIEEKGNHNKSNRNYISYAMGTHQLSVVVRTFTPEAGRPQKIYQKLAINRNPRKKFSDSLVQIFIDFKNKKIIRNHKLPRETITFVCGSGGRWAKGGVNWSVSVLAIKRKFNNTDAIRRL